MRKLYILAWLLAPVAVAAWHYGPGQKELAADKARDHARRATALEARGDLSAAVAEYGRAIAALPAEDVQGQQRLRLAQAQAEVSNGDLAEGQQHLDSLLKELNGDKAAPAELVRSTRHAFAESTYYTALMKRLDGAESEDWVAESEQARENFRLLAEDTSHVQPEDAEAAKKNLEATVKLQQMDLSELLAAAKPKKCKNCKGLNKRKPKNRNECESESDSQKKDQEKEQQPKDARKQLLGPGGGMYQGGGGGS